MPSYQIPNDHHVATALRRTPVPVDPGVCAQPWDSPLPSLEQSYATEHIAQNTLSSEILLCNATRGMRLPLIVVRHRSDGRQRFVFRLESEETCPSGNDIAESCILRDHWPASGEITGAAVAKPATAQTDVLILGNGELAAGGTDVLTVSTGLRQTQRGHHTPTMV